MNAKITLNELNKARARALQWVNRMDGLSFTGCQFIFAHITNALSEVGFDIKLEMQWDCTREERGYIYQLYFYSSLAHQVVAQSVEIKESDKDWMRYDMLQDMIVEACEDLADWRNENGEPSTE